jgi:hypothetical protein
MSGNPLSRLLVATVLFAAAWCGSAAASAPETVLRCGWFDNPTPGNAWLHDRDGEWTIGIQGGHQATGTWPRFKSSEWVRTGSGSAGYGCACMKVHADAESRDVVRIVSARARPLSACRSDAAIKGSEPENPLK